jgi:hypothetical protein
MVMSENKFVFIKELKADQTRQGKAYQYFTDHEGERWNLFNGEKVQVGLGYVVKFEPNGQYRNIVTIEPAINKLLAQAAKELVNRNDIKRDISVYFSYAHDFAIAGKIDVTEMFSMTEQIYKWINEKADNEYAKSQASIT